MMNTTLLALSSTDIGPIIGFLVVLILLLWILKGGKPRSEIPVVESDPPQFPSDSPHYAEHRRKAAAAVMALHLSKTKDS